MDGRRAALRFECQSDGKAMLQRCSSLFRLQCAGKEKFASNGSVRIVAAAAAAVRCCCCGSPSGGEPRRAGPGSGGLNQQEKPPPQQKKKKESDVCIKCVVHAIFGWC